MFTRTVSPEDAPNESTEILIEFKNGDPVKINEKKNHLKKYLNTLMILREKCRQIGLGRK